MAYSKSEIWRAEVDTLTNSGAFTFIVDVKFLTGNSTLREALESVTIELAANHVSPAGLYLYFLILYHIFVLAGPNTILYGFWRRFMSANDILFHISGGKKVSPL